MDMCFILQDGTFSSFNPMHCASLEAFASFDDHLLLRVLTGDKANTMGLQSSATWSEVHVWREG